MLHGFIAFLSFLIASLVAFQFSFLIVKFAFIFSLLFLGVFYISPYFQKDPLKTSILTGILCSFLILVLKVQIGFYIPYIAMGLAYLGDRFLLKKLSTRAIIIGSKNFIEKVKMHPEIEAFGAICFDDKSLYFGENIPNLGGLNDLPYIIKDLKTMRDITIVTDQFIGKQLKNIVQCPILYIDEST